MTFANRRRRVMALALESWLGIRGAARLFSRATHPSNRRTIKAASCGWVTMERINSAASMARRGHGRPISAATVRTARRRMATTARSIGLCLTPEMSHAASRFRILPDACRRWLWLIVGRFLCRIGKHEAEGAGYPWGIRCTRCGRTGHYYEQHFWDEK